MHHKPTIEKIAAAVDKAMSAAHATPRCLIEVGPGKLALTRSLLPLASTHNIPIVLVERDRYLEDEIHAGLSEYKAPVELHFLDAATDKFTALLDELKNKGRAPVFFASNLPYSASSQILANLCARSTMLSGALVMVQKELALRMVAPPGSEHRGAFSLLIQSYFSAKIEFDVGPGAFSPPPKVTSTVLALTPLGKPLTADLPSPGEFERFCKALFSQRRKMIRNLIPPEKHELFPKLGISGTERPEVLDLSTILELFRSVEGN